MWGVAALLVLSTACTTGVDEIHPATSSGTVAPSAAPLPRSTPEAEGVSSGRLAPSELVPIRDRLASIAENLHEKSTEIEDVLTAAERLASGS